MSKHSLNAFMCCIGITSHSSAQYCFWTYNLCIQDLLSHLAVKLVVSLWNTCWTETTNTLLPIKKTWCLQNLLKLLLLRPYKHHQLHSKKRRKLFPYRKIWEVSSPRFFVPLPSLHICSYSVPAGYLFDNFVISYQGPSRLEIICLS